MDIRDSLKVVLRSKAQIPTPLQHLQTYLNAVNHKCVFKGFLKFFWLFGFENYIHLRD